MKKLSKKEKIISWIIITFFVLIIIGALSDDKRSNNLDQETIKPKIGVIKKEKNKDQILKDFLKNELNKDIDLSKNEVKLFIVREIKNPNGTVDKLRNDYPVNIFKTVESDITQLETKLKPGIEVELINYKYDGEKIFDQTLSRCKIKPKNNIYKTNGGWLNCGWLDVKITERSK